MSWKVAYRGMCKLYICSKDIMKLYYYLSSISDKFNEKLR